MPLVHLPDLMLKARAENYALPACAVRDLGEGLTVLAAAEQARAPLVYTLACDADTPRNVAAVVAGLRRAAHASALPIAILGRCPADPALATAAVNAGVTAVLLVPPETAGAGAGIADWVAPLKAAGVSVLVRAAGLTDRRALAAFHRLTGADALALTGGYERLAGITKAIDVPLAVLEGATLHERPLRALIGGGVALIHVEAGVQGAAQRALQQAAALNYEQACARLREAMATEFIRLVKLLGADARAERALAASAPLRTVEHVVAFNAPSLSEAQVDAMFARGCAELGAVPGVHAVFAGTALQPDARYRYAWVMRFAAPEVVAAFRDHPLHAAFADEVFRPVASDRLSIDFVER